MANYAEDYYNIDEAKFNWFTEGTCVVFLVAIPPTFMGLNRSVHWTLFIALVVTSLGLWIRYVAFTNYFVALFG